MVNTPTLRAMKWWPGGLGLSATHAALYAQLVTKGVNHGFHVFVVQLRDEHHKPLPGVEVGEVGPKVRSKLQHCEDACVCVGGWVCGWVGGGWVASDVATL